MSVRCICKICGRDMVPMRPGKDGVLRRIAGGKYEFHELTCPATQDQHSIQALAGELRRVREALDAYGPDVEDLAERAVTFRREAGKADDVIAENSRLKSERDAALAEKQKAISELHYLTIAAIPCKPEGDPIPCSEQVAREFTDLQDSLDAALAQVVVLTRRCETVVPVLDEAMNLLSWLKHDLYGTGKGDYNGKIPCCQEDGEQQLVQLRATIADISATAQQFVARIEREALRSAWKRMGEAKDPLEPGSYVVNSIDWQRWEALLQACFDDSTLQGIGPDEISAAILGEKEPE